MDARAQKILQRIGELAHLSEEPAQLTRTYGSPALRRAARSTTTGRKTSLS